jgi:UDP-N-acetyl-D-galactosamine dehydrogenase
VDVVRILKAYPIKVTRYDPWANPAEVMHEYGLNCYNELLGESIYEAIVLGVAHHKFLEFDMSSFKKANSIVYDVKRILVSNADAKL